MTSTRDLKLFDPSDSFIILKSRSGIAEKRKCSNKRKGLHFGFSTTFTFREIDMSSFVRRPILGLEVVEKALKTIAIRKEVPKTNKLIYEG